MPKTVARSPSRPPTRKPRPIGRDAPLERLPKLPDGIAWAGLALAVVILILHVRTYVFLTDDSFISFRYVRNLVQGHGLVFNPGGERVEGYTNLLWVLLLAGFGVLGADPERTSLGLSFAATAVLFAAIVRFAWVRLPSGRKWVAVIPALLLASTRSFAVWATSGLETRLFDLLLVGGVLRLVHEVEASGREGRPPRTLAPWIFGLAALTRPDGVMVGGCAFLAAIGFEIWEKRRIPWGHIVGWWPLAALVAGHLAFRLAYYGEWVPNTYYAKVGSRLEWKAGALYLAMFILEYGILLWIPGLVAGVRSHLRERRAFLPILFAATVLPHVVYITAIGGDHFEYRPLDYYMPLAFLLIAAGIGAWATTRARAAAAAGYLALVLFGVVWFPLRSHIEFPKEYLPGFPGNYPGIVVEGDQFLDPDRDPIFRTPGLWSIAETYRNLVRKQTALFGGIRQEEHRMFLEASDRSARTAVELLNEGLLPRDLYVAIDCVGVVPYRTDWRTLDRLGLTDAHVAHGPFISHTVAHGKYATMEYARSRGVDFWSADAASPVVQVGSNRLEREMRLSLLEEGPYFTADFGSGRFLLCQLPLGLERTQRRMPAVKLRPLTDSSIVATYVREVLPLYLEQAKEGRINPRRFQRLGEICLLTGDLRAAAVIYEAATAAWPRNWQFSWMLAISRKLSGDATGAAASLANAAGVLEQEGDVGAPARLSALFDQLHPGMSLRAIAGKGASEEALPTDEVPVGSAGR